MEIHNLNKFPDNYEYRYGEIAELHEYDFEDLKNLGIDEVWYWYASGDYEGSGQILMRQGILFDVGDMGHCSCFGPTENLSFKGKTWEELHEYYTKEKYEYFMPLLEMANQK